MLLLSEVGLNATTYFIDFTGGNDANNGLTKATAWKRAPGMRGFTGSYSHVAGNDFIFRGGDTWPTTCFQFKPIYSGVGDSNPTQYTVDKTWFYGGAWTQPRFDMQHTLVSGAGAGTTVAGILIEASHTWWEEIDIRNHMGVFNGSDNGAATVTYKSGSKVTMTNCVIRDWLIPPPASGQDGGGCGGFVNIGGSDPNIIGCEFTQQGVSQRSAVSIRATGRIWLCWFHDTKSGIVGGFDIHDNIFEDLENPTDPAAHGNVIYIMEPSRVYNNIIRRVEDVQQVIYGSPAFRSTVGDTRIFNNVVYDVAQPCIAMDMEDNQQPPSEVNQEHIYIYNNTLYAPGGTGYGIRCGIRTGQQFGTFNVQNNYIITTGTAVCYNYAGQCGTALSSTIANNLVHTPAQASAFGYTTANELRPPSSTSPTVTTLGVNPGADCPQCVTDYDGFARPPWEMGAYVFQTGAPSPGLVQFSSNSYEQAENVTPVVITVKRVDGTSGAASVNYATSNGTAISGINYTATSGTLNWAGGDGADKTFNVTLIDADTASNPTFTVTLSGAVGATLGSPSSAIVTINGTGTPSQPIITGLPGTVPATVANAQILAPFTFSGGYVFQTISTTIGNGGRWVGAFTNVAGTYKVALNGTNMSDANNSFWVNFNTDPTDPNMIFDIPYDPSFGKFYVGWRGTNSFVAPHDLTTWDLPSGTNVLIIEGREANTKFGEVSVELVEPTVSISSVEAGPDGYYKEGTIIPIYINFTTNVDVVGTPLLALNTGTNVPYASGSGSSTLMFNYTVADEQNTQLLDYSSSAALTLNGGTIKHGSMDATLFIPTPGDPGSISASKTIIVDTVPPTASVSAPNPLVQAIGVGAQVYWTVTFSDLNISPFALLPSNVTLNTTGDVNGTIITSELNPNEVQAAALTDITGTGGTASISISAGVASDLAGNTSPEIGASSIAVLYVGAGSGAASVGTTSTGSITVQ